MCLVVVTLVIVYSYFCQQESERGSILRFLIQPWESRTVSVAYQPTEHKPVTSLLLIRYCSALNEL